MKRFGVVTTAETFTVGVYEVKGGEGLEEKRAVTMLTSDMDWHLGVCRMGGRGGPCDQPSMFVCRHTRTNAFGQSFPIREPACLWHARNFAARFGVKLPDAPRKTVKRAGKR